MFGVMGVIRPVTDGNHIIRLRVFYVRLILQGRDRLLDRDRLPQLELVCPV